MRPSKASSTSVQLQNRDITILLCLFESRVMTSAQICALHFKCRPAAAKARLQKLHAAGLIAHRPDRARFEPAIFTLAPAGLVQLHDLGILRQYPACDLPSLERRARVSEITLKHELAVMDVKVALSVALKKTPFIAREFSTWPLLNQFRCALARGRMSDKMVKPDGFLRLAAAKNGAPMGDHSFFLEIDRSTESQGILICRANQYLDHYRSGGFAVRSGGSREEFRKHPFRVLYVLKTAERRNNTIERLLQNSPPILTLVWLTTMEELTSNPLGAIWIRPLDYRDTLAKTTFNQTARYPQPEYRRQTSRDMFVEKNVPKQPLLPRRPA